MFFVRGAQPFCREHSELRVSSVFDLLSLFLLQDEAVEPYLQRDPYTFEGEERVMPGWAQVARRHGQGLLNHNSKILRVFCVSRGLLPQNPNLTLGAFVPQFWGCYFAPPFFEFWARGNCPRVGPSGPLTTGGICPYALYMIILKWEVQHVWVPSCDIRKMRNVICLKYRYMILLKWEIVYYYYYYY